MVCFVLHGSKIRAMLYILMHTSPLATDRTILAAIFDRSTAIASIFSPNNLSKYKIQCYTLILQAVASRKLIPKQIIV